ncbi:MAG TPA: OmpA family protein [Steroidobacteraceae bacterium]|nr:OmpA family protein [Steroidobacteraceae bacterium]
MRTLATKSTLVLAATLGAVFAGTAARADADDVGKWYLNPMIQGVWVDDDRNADDNWGGQIGIGKALSEDWNVELNYAHSTHDGALDNDLQFEDVEVNALRVFYRDSARTNPYLLGGLGWLQKNYETTDNTSSLVGSLGAGLLIHLGESASGSSTTSLRGEVRVRYEMSGGGNTSVDYLAGLGLQFAFGRPRPAAAPEPVVVPPPPPVDSDGDGVFDPQDRCPGTPPNTQVDAVGCELDSDGDGVLDRADRCPNTPAGARVDAQGCRIDSEIQLKGVVFATDKAELLPASYPMLDDAIATLKKNPGIRIEVAGHTDDRGSAAHNQSLSQRRAETVAKYLKDGGVTNELQAVGYGESQPLEDNATEAGRQANRRVVLKILAN